MQAGSLNIKLHWTSLHCHWPADPLADQLPIQNSKEQTISVLKEQWINLKILGGPFCLLR